MGISDFTDHGFPREGSCTIFPHCLSVCCNVELKSGSKLQDWNTKLYRFTSDSRRNKKMRIREVVYFRKWKSNKESKATVPYLWTQVGQKCSEMILILLVRHQFYQTCQDDFEFLPGPRVLLESFPMIQNKRGYLTFPPSWENFQGRMHRKLAGKND